MFGFHLFGRAATALNLTGATWQHTSLGTATSGIRINQDGTVDRRTGSGYGQVFPLTDWIIPNGDAPDDYEVRLESLTGDPFDFGAAVGVWLPLSAADREWFQQRATNGTDSCTAVFGIRKGSSGPALITAEYTFIAFNDV